MSWINRPNVRCREEAKRARENQAKPLVEQDSSQVVEGDHVFNRITVPNSQLDDMSKSVMAILGPYRSVLGGPPLNGLHAAKASDQPVSGCVTDNEKISVTGYSKNSSGANGLRSLSTPSKIQKQDSGIKDIVSDASSHCSPSFGVDSKQSLTPSSLKKSRSSSPSSHYSTSKPGKSSSEGFSSMPSSSSSSYFSVPQHEAGLLTLRQTDEATKEKSKDPVSSCDNGRVKTAIATLETVPSNQNQPSSMRPMKAEHRQPNDVVISSKHSSKSITIDRRSPSSASSRDSQRNTGPSKKTIPISLATNKDKQSSNIHDAKSSYSSSSQPSKTANASTPVLSHSPAAMCLPDLVHTVTPRKMNAGISNGARTPIVKLDQPGIPPPSSHSNASNSRPSSASGLVTTGAVNSTEKLQKLTVVIPSQVKLPTSKSDLNDILKELTEVHAPLTAIHTPQKAENGFHFSTADGHALSPLLENPQDFQCENFLEKSGQAPEESTRITSDLPPSKAAENPQKTKSINHLEISTEAATEAKNAGGRVHTSMKDVSGLTGVQDRTSKCNSSSSRRGSNDSPESGPESVGKTMRDVNSMWRHDLDLSEDDSDAEPTFVENTSASQSKKGKVMSPSLGTIISAVSPMSSDSGSSESSSDSSEDDDDDDDEGDAESRKENGKEKNEKPKGCSERRLSSSGSDTSSSSSSESDSDNDDDDDNDDEGKKVSENKGTVQTSEIMISKESCEKTPSPTHMNGLDGPAHSTVSQNRSWGLVQFLPTPKKSFSSPASVSPIKPGSPSISHSAPASVQPSQSVLPSVQQTDSALAALQQKDVAAAVKTSDENQIQIQQEIGRCDTVPFDLHLFSEQDTSCRQANGDGVLSSELKVCRIRNKYSTSSEKSCRSSLSEESPTSGNTKPAKRKSSMSSSSSKTIDNVPSKKSFSGESSVSVHSNSSHVFRKEVRSSSFSYGSSSKDCGKTDPLTKSNGSQEKVSPNKAKNRLSSSSIQSSTDRNDMTSLVPVVKSQAFPGKLVNEKSRQDFTSKKPAEKSSKLLEHSSSQGRDVPYHDLKHHKRKAEADSHSSSLVSSSSSSTKSASANSVSSAEKQTSKKLFSEGIVTENHKEAVSKPMSLIASSPQSARTSPRESSLKPRPTSQSSFIMPSFSVTSDLPSFVRVIQTPDGIKRHQIMVQIQRSFLSKKVISVLKEKRDRRRFSRDVKLDKSSSKSKGYSDVSKEYPVPVLLESSKTKSSSVKGTDAQGNYQTQKSFSSVSSSSAQAASIQPPRIHRQKSNDHDNNNRVISNGTSSSPEPRTANTKHSSSEASCQRLEKSSSHSSSKSSRTTAAQPTTSAQNNKASSTIIVKHQNPTNGNKSENSSKLDSKQKTEKRKLDVDKEAVLKKTKLDQTSETSEQSNPTIINNRRDSSSRSSSKGSQKSSLFKKSNQIPSPPNHTSLPAAICKDKDVVPNGNSKMVDQVAISNGTETATLPVNRQHNSGVKGAPPSSSALIDLPAPYPVEKHLHNTKHYLARAKEHKHHADGLRDRVGKYEPYLRSGLSFFLAGYTMELSKKELTTSCTMYNDTFNLLQYVVRTQANSSSNVESSDHERKLIALIIRLQAYLNYRQYQLKMAEVGKLRKSIESEQAKLSATAAATTLYSSNSIATAARTHAPSPHQTSWNKSSTGTPSPMSPTPSPASSFSSQGSCEFVNGRIPNGTTNSTSAAMTSPSLGSVSSIQQRLNSATLKYFNLTKPLVKALELWDLADTESTAFGDFFAALDSACGPLSFHSDPPVIVRYLKHALRVHSLMQLKGQ